MGLQCRNRTFQKKRTVWGRFSLSNLHRFATKLCERASLNSLRLKNAAFGCEMHLIHTAIKNNIQLQFYKHPRMPTFVGRLKKCCFNEEVFLSSDYSWLVFFNLRKLFSINCTKLKWKWSSRRRKVIYYSYHWIGW